MKADIGEVRREFVVGSSYRRAGWWALGGMAANLGLLMYLCIQGLIPIERNESFPVVAQGALILLVMVIALFRWRMRLDETGVSRRRLWGWDHWPWEEFEKGLLTYSSAGFASTQRPWWRNELSFELLGEEDRKFVQGVCKKFFQPKDQPPGIPPPESILVRYTPIDTLLFQQTGVVYREKQHNWSEVNQIRLIYFDHESTEIEKIEAELSSRTVRFEKIKSITTPRTGAKGKQVLFSAHLQAFLE